MIPGFRREPRRDGRLLPLRLEDLRLGQILRAELAQGRTGAAYARDRRSRQTGGHMQGHPMVDQIQRSDSVLSIAEGIQYLTNRKQWEVDNRVRAKELDQNRPLDARTTVIGRYPVEIRDELPQVGAVGDLLRRGAQTAGMVGRDLMKQGPQNIYWFANAPEALAGVAALAAQHGSLHAAKGRKVLGRTIGAKEAVSPALATRDVYRTPGAAVASAIPMIGLVGLASGTLNRHEGYRALYPETGEGADPRNSVNPAMELPMRILGRGGNLLSYGAFVKERPDVTQWQYTNYQAYMQGNRSPIKATGKGIHGPEVTMFGKSLPALTALVPLAAGLVGARRGYRMAGNRLAGRGALGREAPGVKRPDEFKRLAAAYDDVRQARRRPIEVDSDEGGSAYAEAVAKKNARVKKAEYEAGRRQRGLDNSLLAGALLGSTAAIGPTVVLTQQLEQFRRANNWQANREGMAVSVLKAEERRKQEAEAAARTEEAVAARGAEALAGLAVLQGR